MGHHFPKRRLSSPALKARLVTVPVSRRIPRAISWFTGPRIEKWSAPFTAWKVTFGLVEDRRIASRELRFPPITPSKTKVGDWIELTQRPGERRSTSRSSDVSPPA